MKILVIGASGGTGREIMKQGLQAGHEMTGLVRGEPKPDAVLPGAKLVIGDALDAAVLKQAVAGKDAVADSLGSSMSGPFKEVHLFSESTRVLIDAMQSTGVQRLVCVTGIGAGDSHGHGGFLYDQIIQPVLLRGVYADKDRQEQMIQASGLDWIIVRPAMLSDGDPVGGTRAILDLSNFHGGSITRADVAAFVLEQITSDTWLHKHPLIYRAAS